MTQPTATVGVLGGSGFYEFAEATNSVEVPTPYGDPSAAITIATIGDHDVAFLPRHGIGHTIPPHRINARANLWALHSLGVRRLFSPCAAGSLAPDLHPGEFVVLDQLVDRTWGRPDTFFDGPALHHVGLADPYCPALGASLLSAGRAEGVALRPSGTVVVVNGPRFSTRAESRWFRAQGWEVVNMTQYPEAALARELGMCFGGVALITDYDTGAGPEGEGDAVSIDAVFAVLADNVARARSLLTRTIAGLGAAVDTAECSCAAGLPSGAPSP